MKTYKELLEEINELEEGRMAKALAITALGLGLYGAARPPMDTDKIHDRGPTPAAHVMTAPPPSQLTAPDVQGKASGLARLLNALAEKRRKKKGEKEKEKEALTSQERESPLPYHDHENVPHLNTRLDFDA